MRAIDLTATQGKEPPQVKPGQYPGEYLEIAVKDLVPVQKVRHIHKTIKATKQVKPSDPSREAAQIERLRNLAKDADLDPEFAEKFLGFILAEVIQHHQELAAGEG
jgi:monofunctional chorismate mutase